MEVETDLLISEVEKRPAIWDMTSSEYSNRTLKRKAWEKLVLVFSHVEDTEDKKKIWVRLELQKKWKSLRDGYVKELKKIKNLKSGSAAPVKSSYLFFRRLQFLQPTVHKNTTESNFETDLNYDENTETENPDQETCFKTPNKADKNSNYQQQRKKIKLHPADEHFANIIEKSLNSRNIPEKKEEDEDKLFSVQQTHLPSFIDSPQSHHASSFVQPFTRPQYPQYSNKNNYSNAPHGTQKDYDHILSNQNRVPTNYMTVPNEMRQPYQNIEPPGTPSPLSGITENSQGSSDLHLFE
ncbi:hypothetical protein QTP88_028356 [Uroleucon formosanum]